MNFDSFCLAAILMVPHYNPDGSRGMPPVPPHFFPSGLLHSEHFCHFLPLMVGEVVLEHMAFLLHLIQVLLVFQSSFIITSYAHSHMLEEFYCQAQFKFSPNSVQFELRLTLILVITPTHPHQPTPGESRFEPLLDYLGRWNLVWKLCSTKLGQLANS